MPVKHLLAVVMLFVFCHPAPAQTNDVDWNAMLDSAQHWARENLDDDVLRALQNVDRDKVEDFLKHYQDYLKGGYVLDLAQLKDGADAILPLLDAHEETQPYAAWLRSRMDYFEVADEMKAALPKTETGTNAAAMENPPFKTEQQVWTRQMAPRPWPKAAVEMVPKLKPIFASQGMPEELVWLAEVESGFDAQARSPAGAVGMFQLMPATAKDFGLSLWPGDERSQPEMAAQAAARYLRQLYGRFGDWRLAVAAYNCGEGTVQKSLKHYRASSYERIATHLPAETQMYVPKVEATILHREGRELEDLKPPAE